ncbi:hypothetical protein [Bradyrhizobium guangzhouense]|uniref:hypothetical protein n=1 Tax=Bradyrhizobium guangzhouense TaxID=1325095 RepID=UPI0010098CD6|nr:hypothetical protein [Bradyrhizobium guangzhouense]RXH05693.1 hypothetical protein EAS54_38970 [Bradyrhizobium guangzhouense]
MTTVHDVFDKDGRRVSRAGVLADGDKLVVRMPMMDGRTIGASFLTDAAQPPSREQLQQTRDARNAAISNAWRQPSGIDAPTLPAVPQSRDEALAQRDQRLRDAWKG